MACCMSRLELCDDGEEAHVRCGYVRVMDGLDRVGAALPSTNAGDGDHRPEQN